jgi:hypothetical protein
MAKETKNVVVPREGVAGSILLIRGQRVILGTDLAVLYGVEPRALIQAVKRNIDRFPADFMFQLNNQELARLKSQIVISNSRARSSCLLSRSSLVCADLS